MLELLRSQRRFARTADQPVLHRTPVEVAGSSPVVPTISFNRLAVVSVFFVAPERSLSGLSTTADTRTLPALTDNPVSGIVTDFEQFLP